MKRTLDDDDVEVENVEEGAADSADEEEDEEEEQGEEAPERKQKKQRQGRNAFIDDVADVEGEEDEEDEEDDDEANEYEEDEGVEEVTDRDAELENRRLDAQRRKEEDAALRQQVHDRYEAPGAQQRYDDEDEDVDRRFQDLPDATRVSSCSGGGHIYFVADSGDSPASEGRC